jgi:hypothetical protein
MILNICCVCVCTAYVGGTVTELQFKQFYSEFNLLAQEFASAGNDLIYLFLLLIFNKIMNFWVQ